MLAGAASVATLPVAVYATRFSDAYELVHAGFAIPLAAALGAVGLFLARRARRAAVVRLSRTPASRRAAVGRVLSVAGLCLAAAGVVALAVYGLLEYAGTRD